MDNFKNPFDVVTAHKQLEESIIREIVNRLLKTDMTITDTAAWQIAKGQEAGVLYENIVKAVADSQGKLESEIKKAFEAAGVNETGFDFDDAVSERIDNEKLKKYSPQMKKIYAAALRKSTTTAINLTKTTASAAEVLFIEACDLAHNQILTGVFTYQQAIANAVKHASQRGATTIEYRSGISRQLDSGIRSAVMTGINQTIAEQRLMAADICGTDIMEITVTASARPEHAKWQGRLVSLSGKSGYLSLSDIGYGEVTGIFGANCSHNWRPFIEGISHRAYSDEELDKINSMTVTYNGEEMPLWKAQEKQRAGERIIRKQKRELVGYDEALKNGENPEIRAKFNRISMKLKKNEQKLNDFCKQTGLQRDRFREQVFAANTENGIKNWSKQVSQKAVWANKKGLTGKSNGGIIKSTRSNTKGEPNSIEEVITKKGGVTRNFYDENGLQKKQISNNDHGNSGKHPFGKNGEHAHDYTWDENGKLHRGNPRELTEEEIKENGDIL